MAGFEGSDPGILARTFELMLNVAANAHRISIALLNGTPFPSPYVALFLDVRTADM